MNYAAEVIEETANRPGTWNSIKVGVFRIEGDKKELIGDYLRNYPSLFKTFYPFRHDDRDYALYSRDYTATRVMELPSCHDIGGEEREEMGFCPTDFYVPCYVEREWIGLQDKAHRHRQNEPTADDLLPRTTKYTPVDEATGERITVEKPSYAVSPVLYYPFGFVAGCLWGDDSSWKIQYLDLSEAHRGIIKREEKFGYVALPSEMDLKQAVNLADYRYDSSGKDEDWHHHISITSTQTYDLRTGALVDPFA